MIYRTAPFSITLNDRNPGFKVTPFFDAENLRNGIYRHSFSGGTSTRPTQRCHFEWSWVILSDLAKHSMTRSVARSLCDSSASCSYYEIIIFGIPIVIVNPLECKGNYSATSNNKLVHCHWWVGCYIWYSEEGTGRGRNPSVLLLSVPNVTNSPPINGQCTSHRIAL